MSQDAYNAGYQPDGADQWGSLPQQPDQRYTQPGANTGQGYPSSGYGAQQGYAQPSYGAQPTFGAQPSYPQPSYGSHQPYATPQPGYQPNYAMATPQVYGPRGAMMPVGYLPKSKVAAGLLAIFLGTLGIHNFYLGKTQRGVIQLVGTIIGWVTSWLVVGIFLVGAIGIWALIEGIMYLVATPGSPSEYARDGQGMPLS